MNYQDTKYFSSDHFRLLYHDINSIHVQSIRSGHYWIITDLPMEQKDERVMRKYKIFHKHASDVKEFHFHQSAKTIQDVVRLICAHDRGVESRMQD